MREPFLPAGKLYVYFPILQNNNVAEYIFKS
jgi:hypothetical protein